MCKMSPSPANIAVVFAFIAAKYLPSYAQVAAEHVLARNKTMAADGSCADNQVSLSC